MNGALPSTLGNLTHLSDLDFSGNQLSGEIPSTLGSLTNLVTLYLRENQLSGAIPSTLGNLINLTTVVLNDNKLSGAIPSTLGSLTNVRQFYLNNNELTGAIPSTLGSMTNVTELSLHDNQLSGAIPSTLGDPTNLGYLELYNNDLNGAIPSTLGNLSNLHDLRLYNNQLTGKIPTTLGDLTNVDTIDLSYNQLTGAIPSTLGGATNLNQFLLNNNQLSGTIPSTLGSLTNLTYLRLENNQLSGAIPPTLGSQKFLYYLDLHSNQLSGAIPSTLGSLSGIYYLYLADNQLSGAIPSSLASMMNLSSLSLEQNYFSFYLNSPSSIVVDQIGGSGGVTVTGGEDSAQKHDGILISEVDHTAYLPLQSLNRDVTVENVSTVPITGTIATDFPDGTFFEDVRTITLLPGASQTFTFEGGNSASNDVLDHLGFYYASLYFEGSQRPILELLLEEVVSAKVTAGFGGPAFEGATVQLFDSTGNALEVVTSHADTPVTLLGVTADDIYYLQVSALGYETLRSVPLPVDVLRSFSVDFPLQHTAASAPVITSPTTATASLAQTFSYQITATNSPINFGANGLPAGLSVNTGTGMISGTPTATGTFSVTLIASNAGGSGSAVLNLTVQQGSSNGIIIINGGPDTARTDQPFDLQVFAAGISSEATFSAEGLPAGLEIDPQTGVISDSATAEGSFGVTIMIQEGEKSGSFTLQLIFTSDPGYPVIVSPGSVSLGAGEPFSYTIEAPVTGVDSDDTTVFSIVGELPPGLTFDPATGRILGTYNPAAEKAIKAPSGDGASVPSKSVVGSVLLIAINSHGTATKPLLFLQAVPQLLNISTRMQVLTDDKVLIGGFIITGNAPKKVLLRAIGPSLSDANPAVSGALADPILELHKPDGTVVTNDNWKDTQKTTIELILPPAKDKESAIIATLDPLDPAVPGSGAYTAIVRGKNGGTGVGLVEVYDLDQAADSQLANISTRGPVGTEDNAMIGGLIIGGADSKVLVRAIGPSLANANPPVPGALQDTILELHDQDGSMITSNDDWKETQKTAITATGVAPKDARESAILMTLAAGNYTAIVRGKNDTTGVALVEVYNITP